MIRQQELDILSKEYDKLTKRQSIQGTVGILLMLVFFAVMIPMSYGTHSIASLGIILLFIMLFLPIFGFLVLIVGIKQTDILRKMKIIITEEIQSKYKITKIPKSPQIELIVRGDSSFMLNKINETFHRLNLKNIKMNEKKKTANAIADRLPKGIAGYIDYKMILIRRMGIQHIRAEIKDIDSNKCKILISVSSAMDALDYHLLKLIEQEIVKGGK